MKRGGAMARVVAALGVILSVLMMGGPAVAAPGPAAAPLWWFDYWNVADMRAQGATGQGITIAVIDTGVQADIPELAGKVLSGADFTGRGSDGRIDFDTDAFGHGTAMSSLMVAAPGYAGIEGLAPDARLLPIAVPLTGSGPSGLTAADALPEAIRWAADHGASIISMSLGGNRDPSRDRVPCPVAHQDAITYAISKGAIVVAASGNGGQEGSPVEEPGVCLGVVSVGAVDASRTVAPFSSRHPYLTLSAPGDQIATLSKVPGVAYVGEGTSQATAIASAALALIWSKFPTLSGRDIVTRLLSSTEDLGAPGHDAEYGYGFIRPDLAISATVPTDAPNPVYEGIAPYLPTDAPSESLAPAPPAGTASAPPGVVEVSAAPPDVPPLVAIGAAAAATGVVMLCLLLVIGIRGRRRRRRVPPVSILAPGVLLVPAGGHGPEPRTAAEPAREEPDPPPSASSV